MSSSNQLQEVNIMSIFDKFAGARHNVSNFTIDTYENWFENDRLFFDAFYQRDYVWTEKEQQEFFKSLLSGYPVGHISLAEIDFDENSSYSYEVVDGKQRLTTLKLFLSNEIPIIIDNEKYFYSDLTKQEQRHFTGHLLPAIILIDSKNEKEKLNFFYDLNFSGVPQSEEHKLKIEDLINKH